jgi:gamma-glutamyltranspeptidase
VCRALGADGDPDFVDVPLDVLLSDEYNAPRSKLINPSKAAAGLTPGVATPPGSVDGAGDGSHLLPAPVRKMYEEATAAARLSALQEENAELQKQLEAARTALAGGGGVSAAGASATRSGGGSNSSSSSSSSSGSARRGRAERQAQGVPRHPYFEAEDEFGNPTSYFADRWDPIHKKDTVHLCVADRFGVPNIDRLAKLVEGDGPWKWPRVTRAHAPRQATSSRPPRPAAS